MIGFAALVTFWIIWGIGAVIFASIIVEIIRDTFLSMRYALWQQVYNLYWETKFFLRLKVFLWDFRKCFGNPDGFTHNMNRNVTAWPKRPPATAEAPSTEEKHEPN